MDFACFIVQGTSKLYATQCAANIKLATGGTKLHVPGLVASPRNCGFVGFSVENKTIVFIPRLASSRRITRANGHVMRRIDIYNHRVFWVKRYRRPMAK